MYVEQHIIGIEPADLLTTAQKLKDEGYRLVQICATKVNGFELSYSFDKDHVMTNYRMTIAEEEEIMSISNIFFPAFLYENEMKDLFGIKITNLVVDFKGNLYKLSEKTPWNPKN
jgi:ech hydrogenase subunit D